MTIGPDVLARLVRFGFVGIVATAIYVGVAYGLTRFAGWGPVLGSIAGYGAAAVFGYFGHKRFTFRSTGSHADDVPRFIAAQLLGVGVATALPFVLTDLWHAPPIAPILLTCVAVPTLNFLVLELLVFRSGRRAAPPPAA